MSELLYPILLAIFEWLTGKHKEEITNPDFKQFSSSYTALLLFFVGILICSKKDLSIFLKIGSFGAICLIMLLIFMIGLGVLSL